VKNVELSKTPDTTLSALGLVIELEELAATVADLGERVVELEKRLASLITPAVVPLTVKELSNRHPTYSEGSLRWLLFHRQTNGLAHAVIQGRGGRLKIDEKAFLEWVAEGREAAPVPVPVRRGEQGRQQVSRRRSGHEPRSRSTRRR